MDWCSVYLTPQGLPKYIHLSPPLIFPTTSNGIRTKNRPMWITPGAAPIRWMGPIRNPRWEQKRTEGYVIVSKLIVRSLQAFLEPAIVSSMFMLSFLFVMACGLSRWKQIFAFFLSFVFMYFKSFVFILIIVLQYYEKLYFPWQCIFTRLI